MVRYGRIGSTDRQASRSVNGAPSLSDTRHLDLGEARMKPSEQVPALISKVCAIAGLLILLLLPLGSLTGVKGMDLLLGRYNSPGLMIGAIVTLVGTIGIVFSWRATEIVARVIVSSVGAGVFLSRLNPGPGLGGVSRWGMLCLACYGIALLAGIVGFARKGDPKRIKHIPVEYRDGRERPPPL